MTKADRTPVERSQAADPAKNPREASETERAETASVPPWTRLSREEITAKLNEVYAEEPSGLDPVFAEMQARSIGPSDW